MLHRAALDIMRDANVIPTDIPNLQRLRLGGNRAFASYTHFFQSSVTGMEIHEKNRTQWTVSTSVVPLHIVSVYALTGLIVKRVPVNDLYEEYLSRMSDICDMVDNVDDILDILKGELEWHSAGSITFIKSFYKQFEYKKDQEAAKKWLTSWTNDLLMQIDSKKGMIQARQDAIDSQRITEETTLRNQDYSERSNLRAAGGLDTSDGWYDDDENN
jgi:uncharacterized membrane-anchored protein YhcB (DUF1043 family)